MSKVKRHRSGLYLPVPSPANPQPWLHGLGSPPLAVVPPPPPPVETTVWDGKFTSLDTAVAFSAWAGGIQDTPHVGAASVGSHTLVSAIAAPAGFPGSFAGRFETYADSTGQSATPAKTRAEIGAQNSTGAGVVEGQSWWYEWYMAFPSVGNDAWGQPMVGVFELHGQFWSSGGPWNTPNFQIKNTAPGGLPQLCMDLYNGTSASPHLDMSFGLGLPVLDQVYRYRMFATWSTVKANGRIQLLRDGVEIVPLQQAQTRPSDGAPQFWKFGTYRTQANGGRNRTVIMGGARRFSIT